MCADVSVFVKRMQKQVSAMILAVLNIILFMQY